jgi:hypothetical protein
MFYRSKGHLQEDESQTVTGNILFLVRDYKLHIILIDIWHDNSK